MSSESPAAIEEVAAEAGPHPAGDGTVESRRELIRQVLQKIDPQAVDKLLPLLGDPDSEVRREAALALEVYGWTPATEVELAQRGVALGLIEDVVALGEVAIEPLTVLLNDPVPSHRASGVEALARAGGAGAGTPIVRALQDEDGSVRLAALHALARVAGTDGLPWLARAMMDPEPSIRDAAATAIHEIDPSWLHSEAAAESFPEWQAACREGSPEERLAARESLQRLGIPFRQAPGERSTQQLAAITALTTALQSPNRDLRQAAAEAMGQLGDGRAIAPLTKALNDPDEWVRRAAVYALHDLGWMPANYPNLAQQAVILHRWDVVCACGEAAVEPLVLALDCSNVEVQLAATRCLGQIGGAKAAEPLSKRLLASTPAIRRAAAEALAAMKWRSLDPALSARQAIALGNWEEAAQYGSASADLLIQVIKEHSPDSEEYRAAESALAGVADPRAVSALLAHARDGQVAQAVVRTLRALLEKNGSEVEVAHLRELAVLSNVLQFQYAFDARYGKQVRTGMEEVDTLPIIELAQRELARRSLSIRIQ